MGYAMRQVNRQARGTLDGQPPPTTAPTFSVSGESAIPRLESWRAGRVIGVLGTEATVRQPYVDRLAAEYAGDCLVLRHGSADLVGLAEAKLRGEPTDPADYRRILSSLVDQPGGDRMDVVVLACTHFPLVLEELEQAAPRPLAFVDGGEGIARRTAWLTRDHQWPAHPSRGRALFTSRHPQLEAYRPGLAEFGLELIDAL